MRWVNIKNGIKQRINEILGTSDNAGSGNDLTTWSIQSAMLTNLRRIVKAVMGNSSSGRPMQGCWMTKNGSNLDISSGLAFTTDGNIVVFKGVSGYVVSDVSPGDNIIYVYLKYENTEVDEDDYADDGKNTGLIGKSGTYSIVNDTSSFTDDYGSSDSNSLIVSLTQLSDPTYVYLGRVTVVGGSIPGDADVENTNVRGLFPNTNDDKFWVSNIKVMEPDETAGTAEFYSIVVDSTSTFTGAATFSSTAAFNGVATFATGLTHVMQGTLDFTTNGTINLRDTGGAVQVGGVSGHASFTGAPASITVKQGIVTSISA